MPARRIPFRFIAFEDFSLGMIADDFAVDEASEIKLLRSELRHTDGMETARDDTACWVRSGGQIEVKHRQSHREALRTLAQLSVRTACLNILQTMHSIAPYLCRRPVRK